MKGCGRAGGRPDIVRGESVYNMNYSSFPADIPLCENPFILDLLLYEGGGGEGRAKEGKECNVNCRCIKYNERKICINLEQSRKGNLFLVYSHSSLRVNKFVFCIFHSGDSLPR